MNWNLIELDSSDSTRFIQPALNKPLFERSRYNNGYDFLTREKKWDNDNIYCYELILPRKISFDESSENMFPDLEKFFNVKASTRKKRIICNVVTLDRSKLMKLPVSNGERSTLGWNHESLTISSLSINKILNVLLEKFTDNVPYINETGYEKLLSFKITSKKGKLTLEDVWAKLNEFGIHKVEKKRSYRILVLKDLTHPGKK
ncbi:hypothetical protein [Pedobacter sp. NJ-S-72]